MACRVHMRGRGRLPQGLPAHNVAPLPAAPAPHPAAGFLPPDADLPHDHSEVVQLWDLLVASSALRAGFGRVLFVFCGPTVQSKCTPVYTEAEPVARVGRFLAATCALPTGQVPDADCAKELHPLRCLPGGTRLAEAERKHPALAGCVRGTVATHFKNVGDPSEAFKVRTPPCMLRAWCVGGGATDPTTHACARTACLCRWCPRCPWLPRCTSAWWPPRAQSWWRLGWGVRCPPPSKR